MCYASRVLCCNRARSAGGYPMALIGSAMVLLACPSTAPVKPDPQPQVVHVTAPDSEADRRYQDLARQANERAHGGDFQAAVDLAKAALRIRPFGLEAAVARIEAQLQLGQRTEALDYATRLREVHRQRPEAAYAHGKALYALGRLNAAADAFADGLVLAPDDRHLRLGLLTASSHDPEVPLDELELRARDLMDLMGNGDGDADVLHALAMAHEVRGDEAGADALYLRAIAIRPHHPFAHFNLALLRHGRGQMAAARPHFSAFLAQAPPWAVREVEQVRALMQEKTR